MGGSEAWKLGPKSHMQFILLPEIRERSGVWHALAVDVRGAHSFVGMHRESSYLGYQVI